MAGIYYYVSLPFVVLLVLATNAAIIMGFLWLDWVPIKLVLILVVGVIVTLYKMVQSLFVRVEAQDPGRVLEASEAPGLWKVVHEVADAVQTRAADEIRVTEGTDMAVYERGTAQQRTRDEATRVLLVGLGLLEGFRQSAFRAVLAHEYGHFSNRDTAGGEIALRVQQDMFKFAMAMIAHGQNVWWNVAFHFLRLYGGLFRRISHGATRLQEVLADRVAAQKYGPGPFEEGLRHAIRRGIEFDAFVNREARRAIALRHSFSDPYLASTPGDDEVQRAVADAMSRETTEDDSHPSPLTRFALVSAVRTEHTPGDTGMVWDLFADPASLRAEMTSRLASRVREVQATV
jgi:Zn-dependent protease with chaperone function